MHLMDYDEIYNFILESGSDNLNKFGGSYVGGVHLQKDPEEMALAIKFFQSVGREFENYLEIGAAAGGSVYIMNKFLEFKRIIIIDDNIHPKCQLMPFVLQGIKYQKMIGNSHNQETMDHLEQLIMKYDIIAFDSDIKYDDAWDTLQKYVKFLNVGGYFMVSNINEVGFESGKVLDDVDNKTLPTNLRCATRINKQQHRLGIAIYERFL